MLSITRNIVTVSISLQEMFVIRFVCNALAAFEAYFEKVIKGQNNVILVSKSRLYTYVDLDCASEFDSNSI
jgi:hypothetical protein